MTVPPSRLRCAIYTRKSTEEGLDREFNSLDAQFEACAAYIASQRHEGWSMAGERYDDGGFSGGNMDRPGLKRLLADVEAGRVDVIVVYKVDRLTRALADFAKIIDVLDARGASFVSVTQSFNTTTSMGRPTLNVLLSFAQFEREVIAERVRDKVAASRKKGMWMGGTVPLGYDVRDRKLVVNEAEADVVRRIMQRYVALGCGRSLLAELSEQGVTTKVRASGVSGIPFRRGSLFYLLKNHVYIGEVIHRGSIYPGEHAAIIDRALWDAVQETIAGKRVAHKRRANASPSILAGLLVDGLGRRMVPSHAAKRGRQYRYYVTAPDIVTAAEPAWRLPAHDLERLVVARIESWLGSAHDLRCDLEVHDAEMLLRVLARASELKLQLDRREVLRSIVESVTLNEGRVAITIRSQAIAEKLEIDLPTCDVLELGASAVRVRRRREVRLVLAAPGQEAAGDRNPLLIELLREAAAAKALVDAADGLNIHQIAEREKRCRTRLGKLYRLAHLAPDIVELILAGRQPKNMSNRTLMDTRLPFAWSEQRAALGIT